MANRVRYYQINREDTDPILLQEAIDFLNSKGKTKIYPYGKGQLCFHHRKCYWLFSPETMRYSPRHRANERWYRGDSFEDVWERINGWLDYRDAKRKEDAEESL